jgi:hypothetical protein
MRGSIALILGWTVVWAVSPGLAAEPGRGSAEWQALLEQWVQTRQMISKARAEWVAEQELLRQTLEMLQNEARSLESALSQTETQQVAVAAERATVRGQQESLEAALAVLHDRLPSLEARLRRLAPALPEPLRRTVEPLWDRLAVDAKPAMRSAGTRLQALVTLLNEMEKFDHSVTLHPELRTGPDGRPVKVQVLYLGLGQAWYVDETGRVAGRGVPSRDGWRWVEEAGLGAQVQEAVAVYEGRRPARYVALPVEVQ